jgi:hypothetical protein
MHGVPSSLSLKLQFKLMNSKFSDGHPHAWIVMVVARNPHVSTLENHIDLLKISTQGYGFPTPWGATNFQIAIII